VSSGGAVAGDVGTTIEGRLPWPSGCVGGAASGRGIDGSLSLSHARTAKAHADSYTANRGDGGKGGNGV